MGQVYYGTIDPETGAVIESRSVQSPITKPKIESSLEKENIGFWENNFGWVQGPGEIWDFWSKGQGYEALASGASTVKKTVAGPFTSITLIVALIAAIVIVPRILPRR
jgi:hypothetical protein